MIYHLVPADYWNAQPTDRPYVPADYQRAGFIHCTRGEEQLAIVANRYFCDDPRQLLVLALNEDVIAPEVKDEPAPDGGMYPHIYGPLNRDAISEVWQMPRSRDGTFEPLKRT